MSKQQQIRFLVPIRGYGSTNFIIQTIHKEKISQINKKKNQTHTKFNAEWVLERVISHFRAFENVICSSLFSPIIRRIQQNIHANEYTLPVYVFTIE